MVQEIYSNMTTFIYDVFGQEWVLNTFLMTLSSLIIVFGILLSDEILVTFWRGYVIKKEDNKLIGLSHIGKVLFVAKEDKRRRKYILDCPQLDLKDAIPVTEDAVFEIKEVVDRKLKYHKGVLYRVTICLLLFSFMVWTIVLGRDGICLLLFFAESAFLVEAEVFYKRYEGV